MINGRNDDRQTKIKRALRHIDDNLGTAKVQTKWWANGRREYTFIFNDKSSDKNKRKGSD